MKAPLLGLRFTVQGPSAGWTPDVGQTTRNQADSPIALHSQLEATFMLSPRRAAWCSLPQRERAGPPKAALSNPFSDPISIVAGFVILGNGEGRGPPIKIFSVPPGTKHNTCRKHVLHELILREYMRGLYSHPRESRKLFIRVFF